MSLGVGQYYCTVNKENLMKCKIYLLNQIILCYATTIATPHLAEKKIVDFCIVLFLITRLRNKNKETKNKYLIFYFNNSTLYSCINKKPFL